MSNPEGFRGFSVRIGSGRIILVFALLLMVFNGIFLWHSLHRVRATYYGLSLNVSQTFFESLLVTRRWNALHNGVYVPVTENLVPNPYLVDPLRDIYDQQGRHLTKVNPAFMTRLLGELMEEHAEITYRITSLLPLNPENIADSFEAEALRLFEEGALAHHEAVYHEGEIKHVRYMAPLQTEESCLSCHAVQGYQLGDVRGGYWDLHAL